MLKIFKRKWQLLSWRQDKYFAVFNELWCQLEWERRELFKKHLCLLIYRLVNWCLEVIGKSHGNITILKHRVQFWYVANFYIIHSLSHLIYTIKKKKLVSQSCLTLPTSWSEATRLLCPWDFPGKNTGVGCHSLLQGFFLIQGSNPDLLHCRQIFYHLSHQGSPIQPKVKK